VRSLVRRAWDTWAATGWRFPIVAASWLVRREYLITARAVDGIAHAPRLPGVRWGRIEDPAQLMVGTGDVGHVRAEIRRRLEEGQECWAAWIAGELAHWRWEATRPTFLPYLALTLHPERGDLCVVDVYTTPRYRRRGLHTAGTFFALERARARGLTRLVGLVARWNSPGRHVMEAKTGRTAIGSVGYWTLGAGPRRYFARGDVRLDNATLVIAAARPAAVPPAGTIVPS
jgi:GNAT superfamily N-acetyltransferase